MNNDLCNNCGACCKNIKLDLENRILYWDGKQALNDAFLSMLYPINTIEGIYACKFLKNNLCTNLNKPEICYKYPSSPFAQLPDSCDYRGEIFIKNENIKHRIRKLKEDIMHYSATISAISDKREQNQLNKIISAHKKIIDKYKDYGSEDW